MACLCVGWTKPSRDATALQLSCISSMEVIAKLELGLEPEEELEVEVEVEAEVELFSVDAVTSVLTYP